MKTCYHTGKWNGRTTVMVGADHKTKIWPKAGLFIYSGFGGGNYFSTTGKVVQCGPSDARGLAEKEGVTYVNRDYKSSDWAMYQTQTLFPRKVEAWECCDGEVFKNLREASDHELGLRWEEWCEEHPLEGADKTEALFNWVKANRSELINWMNELEESNEDALS